MNITRITKFISRTAEANSADISGDNYEGGSDTLQSAPVRPAQDRSLLFLLLAFAFLLPIFFLPYTGLAIASGKNLFVAAFALLGFIMWLVARLKDAHIVVPKSSLLAFAGALALAFLASALFSPALAVSLGGLEFELGTFASIVFLALLTFLASIAFQSPQTVLRLYAALFLSFAVVLLFQTSRLIFGADFLSFGILTERTASIVGKWNDLGIFFGFIAALSLLSLSFLQSARNMRMWSWLVLVLSLLFLSLINFALVWFLVGALALVIVVHHFSFQWQGGGATQARNFPTSAFFVLIVSVLFLVAGASIGNTLSSWSNTSQIEVRPSWSATINTIGETLKESPVLGSGPNRFTPQWLLFKPTGVNSTIFWNTDFRSGVGLIPSFAVTTGILGALAWLAFFVFFLWRGAKALFANISPGSQFVLVSSFVLALYLWVAAFVYVPDISIVALAFLMTGVFVAAAAHEGIVKNFSFSYARDPKIGFVAVLLLILLIIGGALGGYGLIQKSVGLVLLQKGQHAFNVLGNIDIAERRINRAVSWSKTDTHYRAVSEINIARLRAAFRAPDVSVDAARAELQTRLGNAIDAGQQAARLNETNYANWLNLGRIYASVVSINVPGAYESARQSFERAEALNPRGPAVILEQARLEITRGDMAAARNHINRAIEMKSNYAEAIFLLAQLEANEGNIPAAIASVERASLLAPNDTGVFFQLGLLKYNNNDHEGAIPALERAVALTSNYSNARYFLGLSYDKVGRNADAVLQFEEIVRLNPGHAEAESILNNLRNNRDPFANVVPPAVPPRERSEPPINE